MKLAIFLTVTILALLSGALSFVACWMLLLDYGRDFELLPISILTSIFMAIITTIDVMGSMPSEDDE